MPVMIRQPGGGFASGAQPHSIAGAGRPGRVAGRAAPDIGPIRAVESVTVQGRGGNLLSPFSMKSSGVFQTMSNSTTMTGRKFVHAGVFGIAMAMLTGAAIGQQQAAPGGQAGELMQQVQQKQAEIQKLNQQLAEIRQATIEANPELADQRDQLLASVDEKMAEAGHDPEASRKKIQDLQEQLQGGELSAEKNQSVSKELRQEQTAMQQAQSQAMQDEAIRTEIQSLNEDLMAAMREQNPRTDELISQLQTAQQEYQALMQRAMQQQQGGPQQGGPRR